MRPSHVRVLADGALLFNYHEDKFARAFDITTADGGLAHSACIGFSLEQVVSPCSRPVRSHGLARARLGRSACEPPGVGGPGGQRPGRQDRRDAAGRRVALHPFHAADQDWPETDCYVDVWVELLHAHGLDVSPRYWASRSRWTSVRPVWTFYHKPRPGEALRLYGIEVEELTLWKDLVSHLVRQVGHGRIPLVEVDAFYLPDTRGLDYRTSHAKTTIGVLSIDPDAGRLHYLHNRAAFEVRGADYRGLLRLEPAPSDGSLPPFCEIAKLDRLQRHPSAALRDLAIELLREHAARRPGSNPVTRYAACVESDLAELIEAGGETYDLYAFASIRQCGSAFAFAADHLRWLAGDGGDGEWVRAAEAFERISATASMLVLKMARIASSGRLRDLSEPLAGMAEAWEAGMAAVDRALAR
ncbi:MAG: DUF1839 family protein [Myxococcota bacterium]